MNTKKLEVSLRTLKEHGCLGNLLGQTDRSKASRGTYKWKTFRFSLGDLSSWRQQYPRRRFTEIKVARRTSPRSRERPKNPGAEGERKAVFLLSVLRWRADLEKHDSQAAPAAEFPQEISFG
mgnify:CR=1 FL=1